MSSKGWKRIAGAACLVGSIVLRSMAGNTAEADSVNAAVAKDRIVQATQWEGEIAKMKARLSDDSGKLAASAGKAGEEKAARLQVAEDKENLAAFEKMLAAMGSVVTQRDALAETEGDRWTVWGEYLGAGLMVVMGLGLIVSSFMRETVASDDLDEPVG